MTDPIADMLTRIRNAVALKRDVVDVPYSKAKHAIAGIFEKEGWVASVERTDENKRPLLRLRLRYADGAPVIHDIRRISKPGQRLYVGKHQLPVVQSHFGVAIVSTSSGMMTNKEARKRGIGGEVICEIY